MISEGISLMNVQTVHILTPHWNYAKTEQATARSLRAFSHDVLLKKGIDVNVEIYLHSSVPIEGPEYSIDNYMYGISARKDRKIKKIENVLKKAAFDCSLTYERNFRSDVNGSRDCDYNRCKYECYDIDSMNLNSRELDYTTNNLYYTINSRDKIVENIKSMFINNFILDLDSIVGNLESYTLFQIIDSLNYIISNRIIIYNIYNIENYLKEINNIYYLVSNMFDIADYSLAYYSKYPTIKPHVDYDTVTKDFIKDMNKRVINDFILNGKILRLILDKQIYIIKSLSNENTGRIIRDYCIKIL